jgi:hypothetical protein
MKLHALVIAALGVLAVGCATPETKCVTPTDDMKETPKAADASAAPIFDAEELALLTGSETIKEVRVYLDAGGKMRKLAVYHKDADEVPAVVRQKIDEAYPGATVRYYETERYAGIGRVYEVEIQAADGAELEMSMKPDGTLHYLEEVVDAAAIDAAILEKVDARVPGASVVEAESKKGPEVDILLIKVTDPAGRTHYLNFQGGELKRHSVRHKALVEAVVPL